MHLATDLGLIRRVPASHHQLRGSMRLRLASSSICASKRARSSRTDGAPIVAPPCGRSSRCPRRTIPCTKRRVHTLRPVQPQDPLLPSGRTSPLSLRRRRAIGARGPLLQRLPPLLRFLVPQRPLTPSPSFRRCSHQIRWRLLHPSRRKAFSGRTTSTSVGRRPSRGEGLCHSIAPIQLLPQRSAFLHRVRSGGTSASCSSTA